MEWAARVHGALSAPPEVADDEPDGWDWGSPTKFGKDHKILDQRWVTSVAFSQDGTTICTGLFPASVFALWDADSLQCWRVIAAPGSEGRVCALPTQLLSVVLADLVLQKKRKK